MLRRHIFYLSGFDPRGARFYHGLHREALAQRERLTGEEIAVSPRRKGERNCIDWTVSAPDVETQVSFLRWDDLVARAWVKGPLRLGWATVQTYWFYALRQRWGEYWRLGKGPFVTTLYPLAAVLLLPLLIALPLALLLALVLPKWLAALAGLVVGIALARQPIEKIRAFWLIRLFINTDRQARKGFDADTLERMRDHAASIAAALAGEADEVLFVAHSNGSIMAVPLLLDLLEQSGGSLPPKFAFVTYGHCIPLLACRRDAGWFRTLMERLSHYHFRWVDIGSPPDGAAFSLVDPLAPAAGHGAIDLTLLSPRFHRFYDPESYHSGYANKYEIHFDYLRCGDRVSPLDYPALTAGPLRIEQALAQFREIA